MIGEFKGLVGICIDITKVLMNLVTNVRDSRNISERHRFTKELILLSRDLLNLSYSTAHLSKKLEKFRDILAIKEKGGAISWNDAYNTLDALCDAVEKQKNALRSVEISLPLNISFIHFSDPNALARLQEIFDAKMYTWRKYMRRLYKEKEF